MIQIFVFSTVDTVCIVHNLVWYLRLSNRERALYTIGILYIRTVYCVKRKYLIQSTQLKTQVLYVHTYSTTVHTVVEL